MKLICPLARSSPERAIKLVCPRSLAYVFAPETPLTSELLVFLPTLDCSPALFLRFPPFCLVFGTAAGTHHTTWAACVHPPSSSVRPPVGLPLPPFPPESPPPVSLALAQEFPLSLAFIFSSLALFRNESGSAFSLGRESAGQTGLGEGGSCLYRNSSFLPLRR